jgi:hypothetical protein
MGRRARGRISLPSIMGGPFTGNSESYLKGGSGNGASLSMGALLGEREGGGGSFARGTEVYERKALRMSTSPHGGSDGQPGVDSSTGDFEIWLKVTLGVECLSLWELCEGNLERAPLLGTLKDM